MTVDVHAGRVTTIMSGKAGSSSSGRIPLQTRNPNAMRSFGASNSSSEEFQKSGGLSSLEVSNNEMNKRLTSSASYTNSSHMRRVDSNKELPTSSSSSSAVNNNNNTGKGSSLPRPETYSRSASVPSKLNDDEVIIEEKRRKANGDGYTIHRYLRGRLLGKGGFAKVYLCTALDTNKLYAVKIVPKANLVKARARQKLQAEIKIHRTLKHKHVCEYKHFFEDRQNCYILLELCHNQSMNEMIKRRKRLTEPEAAYFMRQLLQATQYLHNQLVIHRDLKLGNLFLDRYLNIKVGDLGLATRLESAEEKRKTICGTPNYIAPEVIQGDRATRGHSFEVDVWSMGVILFTVLVGKPPYEAKDVKATYKRILNNEYSFPKTLDISDSAKDLIRAMLQSKPSERPTLKEIAQHPFLNSNEIPISLPSNVTHTAPKWEQLEFGSPNFVLDTAQKPNLPLSSLSQRKPFSYKDVNVETTTDRSKSIKAQLKPSLDDFQGVVKNVASAVMSAVSKTPTKVSTFKVFDENEPTKSNHRATPTSLYSDPVDVDLAARTEAMSIKTTNPSASASTPRDLPSPISDDIFVLNNMIDRIDTVLEATSKRSYTKNMDSPSLQPLSAGGPTKWVSRYVDYTSKYGLGFLLSDGSSGVYFNDSTKAILEADGDFFQYIERNKVSSDPSRRGEPIIATHNLSKHPMNLQKKVTLLKHFRNYLIEQQKKSDDFAFGPSNSASRFLTDQKGDLVYLKKWVRTKHAIFFRLSDNTVQIVFYDHTEILMTPDERHITYVNKQRERTTYYLTDELVGCNAEINKRVKYTKEILLQLVAGKSR